MSGNRSLAGAIAAAVAETKGVAPESLPPLYESIDPDALDAVVATSDAVVSFRFADHAITVESGTVRIEP